MVYILLSTLIGLGLLQFIVLSLLLWRNWDKQVPAKIGGKVSGKSLLSKLDTYQGPDLVEMEEVKQTYTNIQSPDSSTLTSEEVKLETSNDTLSKLRGLKK